MQASQGARVHPFLLRHNLPAQQRWKAYGALRLPRQKPVERMELWKERGKCRIQITQKQKDKGDTKTLVIYWLSHLLTCSAKSFFFSLVLSTGSQLGASAQNHTWLQNAPCMSATLTRAKTTINNPKIEVTKDEKEINAKKKSGGGIRKHLKFLVVKEKLMSLCNKMTPKSRLFFFRKRSNCSNT